MGAAVELGRGHRGVRVGERRADAAARAFLADPVRAGEEPEAGAARRMATDDLSVPGGRH